jgi:hypothetical protein
MSLSHHPPGFSLALVERRRWQERELDWFGFYSFLTLSPTFTAPCPGDNIPASQLRAWLCARPLRDTFFVAELGSIAVYLSCLEINNAFCVPTFIVFIARVPSPPGWGVGPALGNNNNNNILSNTLAPAVSSVCLWGCFFSGFFTQTTNF